MSMSMVQSGGGVHRVSVAALAVGLLVSAGLHLGAAVGAGGYLSGMHASDGGAGRAIEIGHDPAELIKEEERAIRLGRRESTTASIHWLGVVENPVEGAGQESEVEQAQFTPRVGDAEVTSVPEAEAGESAAVSGQEGAEAEPVVAVDPAVVEEAQAAEEAMSPEVEAEEPVEETGVAEVLEIPEDDAAEVVIETAEEPEDERGVPAADERVDPELVVGPELVSVEREERETEDSVEAAEGVMGPAVPEELEEGDGGTGETASEAAVAGSEGIVSERESAASVIKRAVKVDAKELNRPIAGAGLEILPVEPRFPASVRFTQLPRNPVVLIRFNAAGRVGNVRFLREEERVYDTGSRAVDEPLMNAIYQWRAKGEELAGLDPEDPESTIEISMRILFRPE